MRGATKTLVPIAMFMLLAYSRLGTRGKDFELTDCEAVFEQVIANLKTAIEESGAVMTYDALPAVMADDAQLGRLFQNLIENAIKFRNEAPPHIHVSAKAKANADCGNVLKPPGAMRNIYLHSEICDMPRSHALRGNVLCLALSAFWSRRRASIGMGSDAEHRNQNVIRKGTTEAKI